MFVLAIVIALDGVHGAPLGDAQAPAARGARERSDLAASAAACRGLRVRAPAHRGRDRGGREEGAERREHPGDLGRLLLGRDLLREVGEHLAQLIGVLGAVVGAAGLLGDRLQRRLVGDEEPAAAAAAAERRRRSRRRSRRRRRRRRRAARGCTRAARDWRCRSRSCRRAPSARPRRARRRAARSRGCWRRR